MTRKHKRTTINLLHAARTPTGLRPWGTLLSLALLWSQSACHSFDSNDVIPTEPDMMESPSDLADPSVPCAECFPLEQLPPTLRARAESLLLAGLDSEALYTVAATIKPMSSGFLSLQYPTDMPEPTTVGEARQILSTWHCGSELSAGLQVFDRTYDGKRYADGVVFYVPGMRSQQQRFASLFEMIGVRPEDSPLSVILSVDKDSTTRRFAGYGYLFGYPDHAVDFFVQAAEEEKRTGMFVPRDFIQIPTYVADTGRFVYAVPKGHKENDDDRSLRERTARVLSRYRALRSEHIGADNTGVLALVRAWFTNGQGRCSPRYANK